MASSSRGEEADSKAVSVDSFSEVKELHEGAQLEESDSRKLREQGSREDINSTRELVAAYNQAENEDEAKALHLWLQRYSAYLNAGFAKALMMKSMKRCLVLLAFSRALRKTRS